jgi:hypothetical protein
MFSSPSGLGEQEPSAFPFLESSKLGFRQAGLFQVNKNCALMAFAIGDELDSVIASFSCTRRVGILSLYPLGVITFWQAVSP